MLVRSVRPHGHFRWNNQDGFLCDVLWRERVGVFAEDDRRFTIQSAPVPIAVVDSQNLRITLLLDPAMDSLPLPRSHGRGSKERRAQLADALPRFARPPD